MSHSSFEEEKPIFIPDQIESEEEEEEETIRIQLLKEDHNMVLKQYEREMKKFEKAIEKLEELKQEKKKVTSCIQQEIIEIQKQLSIYNTRKANLKFELEQTLLKQMNKVWYLTTVVLFFLMLSFYHKGLYLLTVLNGWGFFANWRLLYIRNAHYSPLFGVVIASFTIILSLSH